VSEVYGWMVIASIFATSVFALGRIWEKRSGQAKIEYLRGRAEGYKAGFGEGFVGGGIAVHRRWIPFTRDAHSPNSRWTPGQQQSFPAPQPAEPVTAEVPAVKAHLRPVGLAVVHPRPPQAPRHAARQ
jgi:hypothetical protein